MVLAVNEDVIWSCTTCRSCEENYPVMISHVDKIVDLRRYLVLTSELPKRAEPNLQEPEQRENPWGLSAGSRADWLQKRIFRTSLFPTSPRKWMEVVFWVGCAGAYDDQRRLPKRSPRSFMREVSFAILAKDETCTGDPARRWEWYLFHARSAERGHVKPIQRPENCDPLSTA